jgi:hypothetical protein
MNSNKGYTFRFIHTNALDDANISYDRTPGVLKIAELNRYHFDIKGLQGPSAIALARIMRAEKPLAVKHTEFLNEVAAYVRNGAFDASHLTKDVLSLMNKVGSISFRRRKPKGAIHTPAT